MNTYRKAKIIINHHLNVSGIVFAEKVDQEQSALESLVSTFRAKPLKQNKLESTTNFQFYPKSVKVRTCIDLTLISFVSLKCD